MEERVRKEGWVAIDSWWHYVVGNETLCGKHVDNPHFENLDWVGVSGKCRDCWLLERIRDKSQQQEMEVNENRLERMLASIDTLKCPVCKSDLVRLEFWKEEGCSVLMHCRVYCRHCTYAAEGIGRGGVKTLAATLELWDERSDRQTRWKMVLVEKGKR